jgi:hypothetical protein
MMEDPRMKDMDMPFDGKRMMWGGFQTIFEGERGRLLAAASLDRRRRSRLAGGLR